MSVVKHNPALVTKVIALSAPGTQTQQEIADNIGVNQSTICRIQKANQELIQREAQKYLDLLPNIVQNDLREIQDYFTISKTLSESLIATPAIDVSQLQRYAEFVNTKITDIKRSIGIYSAHSPGLVFQQLNIFNSVQSALTPQILQLLQGVTQSNQIDYNDVVDADVVSS